MTVDMKKLRKETEGKKNVTGRSGKLHKKISKGKERPVFSYRVYVEKKWEHPNAIADLERTGDLIPKEIDGVPTDVIEVGEMNALALENPKQNFRPTKAGVSAITEGGTACTLGWYARDNTDGKIVIIANNHCTSQENRKPIGTPYLQTSPLDKNHGAVQRLGTLKRYVSIKYAEFKCPYRQFAAHTVNPAYRTQRAILGQEVNRVDLGIIAIDDIADIEIELLNVGKLWGKRRGSLGELMMKQGRTTVLTKEGSLFDNDYYGSVNYSRGKVQVGPCGLVKGDDWIAGGDSSSAAVFETDRKFAGLNFAGSSMFGIFCHYDYIEQDGDVTIIV